MQLDDDAAVDEPKQSKMIHSGEAADRGARPAFLTAGYVQDRRSNWGFFRQKR
jgi:hypothetical protein